MGSNVIVRGGLQQPQGMDPNSLVQLALAVKQAKMQETAQDKQEAMQQLQMSLQLIQQGLTPDSKSIEKPLKTLGINLEDINPTQPPGKIMGEQTPIGGTSVNPPNPTQLMQLGNAVQGGKAGAQAGAGVSKQAAAKNPGGGVIPDIMNEQTISAMGDAARAKFGALAPLYQSAMTQQQLNTLKARHEMQVSELQDKVMNDYMSGNPNYRDMGMLAFMADPTGKGMTDQTSRALLMTAGNDKERQAAIDFITGNEAPGDRAKRVDSLIHDVLTENPGIDPQTAQQIGTAIGNGSQIPADALAKYSNVESLSRETDAFIKLSGVLPLQAAKSAAQAYGMGASISDAVPKGVRSLAEMQLQKSDEEIALEQKRVGLEQTAGEINLERYKAETLKLRAAEMDAGSKEAVDELAKLATTHKLGMKIPKDVVNNAILRVAAATGMKPEEVQSWWGTTTTEWKPAPDTDTVNSLAGAPQGQGLSSNTPPANDLKSLNDVQVINPPMMPNQPNVQVVGKVPGQQ